MVLIPFRSFISVGAEALTMANMAFVLTNLLYLRDCICQGPQNMSCQSLSELVRHKFMPI